MRNRKTSEVIERFAKKREEAEKRSEALSAKIYEEIPEIKEIDGELRATSLSILNIAASGEDIEEKMAKLKERNLALRKRRGALLVAAGYPEDYTAVHFECPKCFDTGFVGVNVCDCLKKAVAEAAFEDSGIGNLVKTQSFETFDLSYYTGDARALAEKNFKTLKNFADNFDPENPKNFLLMGATGLGKTHLSTSVAKAVIEKGYKVVYETIDDVLSDFEAERFKGTLSDEELKETYYMCDLLIIDDLGCEISNQFSLSCIYNLINSRINNRRSTIINTNLTYDDLRGIYADRITSRLFGEFSPLMFKGQDVRRQKLSKK